MDFLLDEYKDHAESIIDFNISDKGELKMLTGSAEEKQRAIVASFTQRGSIPQLPDTGIQWAEFLTGDVGYAELNAQVLDALHNTALTYAYMPIYTEKGSALNIVITEVQ